MWRKELDAAEHKTSTREQAKRIDERSRKNAEKTKLQASRSLGLARELPNEATAPGFEACVLHR
jgi:hypothetical protein